MERSAGILRSARLARRLVSLAAQLRRPALPPLLERRRRLVLQEQPLHLRRLHLRRLQLPCRRRSRAIPAHSAAPANRSTALVRWYWPSPSRSNPCSLPPPQEVATLRQVLRHRRPRHLGLAQMP